MAILLGQELADDIEKSITEIAAFVNTDKFQALLSELRNTPASERSAFVRTVIINKVELEKRNIHVPEGMIIQRSTFGDG